MTGFFSQIRQRKVMKSAIALSREIAQLSQSEVWDRVRQLIFDMDLVEARGYVRARAAAVIRRELSTAGKRANLSADVLPMLTALATERVVHLVLTDYISGGPAGRRAAA